MRKLKLQIQMTIDGFISGENGEMDWMTFNWSEDLKDFVKEITDPVDTILLGRKLAEGFIPYWTEAFYNPNKAQDGAEIFVKTAKIVFTKTLDSGDSVVMGWENTVLAHGDLVQEVNELKNAEGGDIIVYGGGQFVSSLIREKLIDELNLFINPAAIGNGMPIFREIGEKHHFKLISTIQYECGIVVLTYCPI